MPPAERLLSMRRLVLMVAVMVVVASCGSSEVPLAAEPLPSAEELIEQFGVTPAELQDVEFIAAEEGWTLAEALNRLGWQQGFSTFVDELRSSYPDDFAGAGILFEEGPRDVFIAFRTTVPPGVRDDPFLQHLDVDFREATGFTEEDLASQTLEVHQAMLEAGFTDVGTGPDVETGMIRVDAVRRTADRGKTYAQILAGLPPAVRADNVMVIFHDHGPLGGDD